jgi:predicted nucleotidyltransferase
MIAKKTLTRRTIIQTLIDALKPLTYVQALYEGGAAAFKRIDKWSDIDIYIVVDDDKVNKAFLAVEKALKSLSRIQQKYEILQTPWPGISQAFYRLEDANEHLIIDLAILKLSSPDMFLEPEIHGYVVFYFNKNGRISLPRLDKNAFAEKVHERLQKLQARFDMFGNFVQKEINRGNCLEAIDLYNNLVLAPLIETLRIKHNPVHHDFKRRYVHYELPLRVVEKLKHLNFIKDEKDLQKKYQQATIWFRETMSEVDQKKIERLVKKS